MSFDLPTGGGAPTTGFTLPSSAIIFRGNGTEIAVLGPDEHVHIRHVTVGRNLGSTVEIASGLSSDDRVVNNPPDSIAEGQLVRVIGAAGG